MPVVFPGFSWHNMNPAAPFNRIPRRGGRFYWRQVGRALQAGNTMLYGAMFDEVDEGTAMFKVAATRSDAPEDVPLVTLDVDGERLPSDWYSGSRAKRRKRSASNRERSWQATFDVDLASQHCQSGRQVRPPTIAAVVIALCSSSGLLAQSPKEPSPPPSSQTPDQRPPTFRTGANFVRVDVYPTRDGKPVVDLTAADFEVLEDGVAAEGRDVRARRRPSRRAPDRSASSRRPAGDAAGGREPAQPRVRDLPRRRRTSPSRTPTPSPNR